MKKTIIVMPVANEEKTMANVLDEILELSYQNLYIFPILDSYSNDRTQEIVKRYEKKTGGRVRLIFFGDSKGVVSCYLYGFKQALLDGADYIIEMDGGGSHLPAEIPQFIDGLDRGYDCIFGSRFINGGGSS